MSIMTRQKVFNEEKLLSGTFNKLAGYILFSVIPGVAELGLQIVEEEVELGGQQRLLLHHSTVRYWSPGEGR